MAEAWLACSSLQGWQGTAGSREQRVHRDRLRGLWQPYGEGKHSICIVLPEIRWICFCKVLARCPLPCNCCLTVPLRPPRLFGCWDCSAIEANLREMEEQHLLGNAKLKEMRANAAAYVAARQAALS